MSSKLNQKDGMYISVIQRIKKLDVIKIKVDTIEKVNQIGESSGEISEVLDIQVNCTGSGVFSQLGLY